MAALSDADRREAFGEYMTELSTEREGFGNLTKPDILAAAIAIDDFLVANAAAINSNFPQPFRGEATTAQKSRLMRLVMKKRFEKGA